MILYAVEKTVFLPAKKRGAPVSAENKRVKSGVVSRTDKRRTNVKDDNRAVDETIKRRRVLTNRKGETDGEKRRKAKIKDSVARRRGKKRGERMKRVLARNN